MLTRTRSNKLHRGTLPQICLPSDDGFRGLTPASPCHPPDPLVPLKIPGLQPGVAARPERYTVSQEGLRGFGGWRGKPRRRGGLTPKMNGMHRAIVLPAVTAGVGAFDDPRSAPHPVFYRYVPRRGPDMFRCVNFGICGFAAFGIFAARRQIMNYNAFCAQAASNLIKKHLTN